jgi:hypothetical protein
MKYLCLVLNVDCFTKSVNNYEIQLTFQSLSNNLNKLTRLVKLHIEISHQQDHEWIVMDFLSNGDNLPVTKLIDQLCQVYQLNINKLPNLKQLLANPLFYTDF